jgi:hypothetical protein
VSTLKGERGAFWFLKKWKNKEISMMIVIDLFQSQKLVDLTPREVPVNTWNTFIRLLPHFSGHQPFRMLGGGFN